MAEIAVDVAHDSAKVRAHIANHRGLLFDREEPIRAIEAHLLRVTGQDA